MLYGSANSSSLNMLRCTEPIGKVSPRWLPPIENSFKCHMLNDMLHSTFALESVPVTFECDGHCWEKNQLTGLLEPVMMTQEPGAPELLNDIVCECDDECAEQC